MKAIALILLTINLNLVGYTQSIPLPEHPNPIKKRSEWINLNGQWDFKFDSLNEGIDNNWASGDVEFDKAITVPFSWGSKLSGISDDADIGWYKRNIKVTSEWKNRRVFIILGASDWETQVWLDGKFLGSHQGGYVPFEFELTDYVKFGKDMSLVIRVDDIRRPHTLYGKQGYGNARGIWQTVYLESRGKEYIENIHFTPDIDNHKVEVKVYLPVPVKEERQVSVKIKNGNETQVIFKKDQRSATSSIEIPNQKLWSLNDPFLYEVEAVYGEDILESYFGMRKIGVMNLPGTDIPYISLNNEPIYLQLTLDQSYHPDGFYTFPSDQFIIDEINRSKSIGLNGIRTHIKVEVPRKLYWADKLGLLVMEDLPNSWGEPEELMQKESTYTLREMIKRDYNHPSIFSWIIMNETWGLRTNTQEGWKYLPETQQWLVSMYNLAKSLDQSRLVEDNSICCGVGHTKTDINSWHVYLPGYAWDEYLKQISDSTFLGSTFHYEDGYSQGSEPNINSECGNVWGYDGSTGDVDWSWDYHRMINSFRKHPKIGGWLYTEHHDVINEWNGYWRFDRTEKFTGLEEIVPQMSLNDLHSDVYVSTGQEICYSVKAGNQLEVPLFLSSMSSKKYQSELKIEYQLNLIDYLGKESMTVLKGDRAVAYKPWMQQKLDPIKLRVPETSGLATLQILLKTPAGEILHRNFVHIIITEGKDLPGTKVLSVKAKDYSDAQWTEKTWDAMEGFKVNGAGNGYFEYTFNTEGINLSDAREVYFITEASAKQLFVKDQEEYQKDQDFMLGSRVAPSSNPNSYPMTDETLFPSRIKIYLNDKEYNETILPDDPADHRGVLSWFAQPHNGKLREAGSYGYLVKIPLTREQIQAIDSKKSLKVRLEAVNGGGLAIYGKDFGRYPLDPSIVVNYNK